MRSFIRLPMALVGVMFIAAGTLSAQPQNLRAHLSGGEEVPPVVTRARGQAIFQLSPDGTELSYKLIVANIHNVTQAHIHLAPAGANGPLAAWPRGSSLKTTWSGLC